MTGVGVFYLMARLKNPKIDFRAGFQKILAFLYAFCYNDTI